MDIGTYKVKSSIADIISGYGTEKSSTASSKSFNDVLANMANSYTTTQKTESNSNDNPFKASSFDFQDWFANRDSPFDRQMYTKTEPARSDEEILKDMAELAKKHARQGTFQEFDNEFSDLLKEYISPVSPDRESILNKAVNEIIERTNQDEDYSIYSAFQQLDSQRANKEDDEKELIDYLLEILKNNGNRKGSSGTISSITQNGDCYEINIDHGGGMTTTLYYAGGELTSMSIGGNNYSAQLNHYNGAIDFAQIRDDNGNLIASYHSPEPLYGSPPIIGGLYSCHTSEEIERRKEILAAYNASYDFAIGKYSPPPSESETYEIYTKTYDELRKAIYA
jgi:flagellar hook-basal body complex protein FliE